MRYVEDSIAPTAFTTAARARSPPLPPRIRAACSALKSNVHFAVSLRSCRAGPHGDESDAHGVLSLRSSHSGTSWSMRCEATHIPEPASEAVCVFSPSETDMDCDHSAFAVLIVFCSKLGEWCTLTEVRSDVRCASKVNFSKIRLGRQAFHHLPELSGDDDVGGGLSSIRSWVKGGAHKGFPVGDGSAACSQSVGERSLEISLFVRGTQIQHADGRVVRSIEHNGQHSLVRVTIQTLVPFTLGTLYRPRQQVLVRVYQGNEDAFHEGTKCHMRVVSVRRSLMQRVP